MSADDKFVLSTSTELSQHYYSW